MSWTTIDVLLIVIGSFLQLAAIALGTTLKATVVSSHRVARIAVVCGLVMIVIAGLHALPTAFQFEASH